MFTQLQVALLLADVVYTEYSVKVLLELLQSLWKETTETRARSPDVYLRNYRLRLQ